MEELRRKIGEAIGEASVCWNELPVGVFDSTKASAIVDRIIADVTVKLASAEERARQEIDSFKEIFEANQELGKKVDDLKEKLRLAQEVIKGCVETLTNIRNDYYPNAKGHDVYMHHSSMATEELEHITAWRGNK